MKKLFKFLLNLAMAIVAVGLTLIILFFVTPSWQKSAVEKVLEEDSTRQWQVGSVHVRPMVVEVEEAFVLDESVGVEVKYARISGPLWKLPFTGRLEVDSGEISGLVLDLGKIKVGDPTAEDYQDLLKRVSGDPEFWEERVGLVLSKFSASGLRLHVRNLQIGGMVLMPGGKVIPVRWFIIEADSDAPRLIKVTADPEQPHIL
ncbi:MAG: hypothetical protein AB3N64_15030 [Puniceicoccaceae bacterium]